VIQGQAVIDSLTACGAAVQGSGNPVNEKLRRALVRQRVKQLRQLTGTDVEREPILEQDVLQISLASCRLPGRFLDESVGSLLTELSSEAEGNHLAHVEATRRSKIGPHAVRVHVKALGNNDHGCERARGNEREHRQAHPFRLPVAQSPLMLM